MKHFFCQFPNPWALRVSGMGFYTSKCEKIQHHCTLTNNLAEFSGHNLESYQTCRRGDCEKQEGKFLKTFVPNTSENSASVPCYYRHHRRRRRRELTQHGALPCHAGGEGWRGDDLYSDGLAVPPAMTYCTACPPRELLSCELMPIPAAAAAAAGILYY